MSLSCRCIRTPNGFSPLVRNVTSEQVRAPQRILDVADGVDDVARGVLLENVAIANARAHGDRDITEGIRRRDVCFRVADDDRRIVIGHRLSDEARLLERGIWTGGCNLDALEEGSEREYGQLRAKCSGRGAKRDERAPKRRGQSGEHRDCLGEQDVESETVRDLDQCRELVLEWSRLALVEPALREDLGHWGTTALEVPVGRSSQRLAAERGANGA